MLDWLLEVILKGKKDYFGKTLTLIARSEAITIFLVYTTP